MKAKYVMVVFLLCALPASSAFGDAEPVYTSKYAGQEHRTIKSLSEQDIEELKSGAGWGLAKAAELNGVPGPAHLLEMKDEIQLTSDQIRKIEALYKDMKQQAIPLGLQLIEYEAELNHHFANGTIDEKILQELVEKIAQTYKELRYVHLSAHL